MVDMLVVVFTDMNALFVLSVIGHDVASTSTFSGRKRVRSNDVTTARMPRAKRKCGLCGEEGKLSYTRVVCVVST